VKQPKKENPIIHQDCADAALYLWRHCYTYLFTKPKPVLAASDQRNWENPHIEKLIAQVKKEHNPNELDIDWKESWDQQWEEEAGL
jgi:hypothetical protein